MFVIFHKTLSPIKVNLTGILSKVLQYPYDYATYTNQQ